MPCQTLLVNGNGWGGGQTGCGALLYLFGELGLAVVVVNVDGAGVMLLVRIGLECVSMPTTNEVKRVAEKGTHTVRY